MGPAARPGMLRTRTSQRRIGTCGSHQSTPETTGLSLIDQDWLLVVQRLRQGDPEALVKLTRLITGVLARQGAYDLRDTWDDLCQEVLIALVDNLRRDTIREPRAVLGFIGSVTRNKLNDWLRRNRHSAMAGTTDDPEALAAVTADTEEPPLLDRDARLDLEQALQRLPERQRQVVEHLYILGHSYEEAARKLELPLGTLKREQTQGLKALRETLRVRAPP